jgi:hypothetical protein
MASESIGSVYPTQIPGYDDAADIQAALKLYHYGSSQVPANEGVLIENSVAGHLKSLDTRVDGLEVLGIGSEFSSSEPTDPEDGFIWVDSESSFGVALASVAAYQNDAPSVGLVDGLLWVDKNSSPLKMYVYDAEDEEWKEIGA